MVEDALSQTFVTVRPAGLDLRVPFVSISCLQIYYLKGSVICLAECNPGCTSNGGQCLAPFKCVCPAGVTGATCTAGTHIVTSEKSNCFDVLCIGVYV